MSRGLPHDAALNRRRVLPSSQEAEESVIGGILFSGRALVEVADILEPGDFYDQAHEAIYGAMVALEQSTRPIDIVTVAEEMRRDGTLSKLLARGREAYLAELATTVATVANIAHHARIVRSKSTARKMLLAASEIVEKGYADDIEVDDYVAQAQQSVLAVTARSLTSEPQPIRAALLEAATSIEARYRNKSAVVGITWGLSELDEMTGGRQAGRLEVLGGRPGHGKSALALQSMLAGAEKGHPGLMFSLEMMKHELGERALAQEARVDGSALRAGMIQEIEFYRAVEAVRQLKDLPIWVDDHGGQDVYAICAKARRWHRKHAQTGKQAQIVVDFLQLVKASSSKNRRSREEEVGEISRTLKALAKELEASVLALASLNRECEKRTDKRPTPSDLRDSGSIESDADLILMVYRDELYNTESKDKGIAELIVGKHRGGPVGTVQAKYFAPQTRFAPLSWRNDT